MSAMKEEAKEKKGVRLVGKDHIWTAPVIEVDPHWVGSITTNTDGEVKVKFYYDDGVVCIY